MNNNSNDGDPNFSFTLSLDAAPRTMPGETDVYEVEVTDAVGRQSQAGNDMVLAELTVLRGHRTGNSYKGDRIKKYLVFPKPGMRGAKRIAKTWIDTLTGLGHPKLDVMERFKGVGAPIGPGDLVGRKGFLEFSPPPEGEKYPTINFIAPSKGSTVFAGPKSVDPLGKTASV